MSVHLNTSYSSYTDTGYENKKSNNSKVTKMTQEQDKTNDTALKLILAKFDSMEETMKSQTKVLNDKVDQLSEDSF